MISTIFRKIINDEKGGVEFIESSIVFPIILFSISFLFIITFSLINKMVSFELTYANSRELLNYENKNDNSNGLNHGYLLLKESELNDKLAKYKKRVDISYDNGIFYDQIENISSGEKYLISNKVSIVDNSRKIDFVGHVFSDLKYRRVENNYIQSIFDNIVEIKDGLVKKINHE